MGGASGRVLPDSASFMLARSQANPQPIGLKDRMGPSCGAAQPTRLPPDVLDDNAFRFTAQYALPQVMRYAVTDDVTYTYLAHHTDGSWARVHRDGDDWLVEQGGGRAVWDELEAVHEAWLADGAPEPAAFDVNIDADGDQLLSVRGTNRRYQVTTSS